MNCTLGDPYVTYTPFKLVVLVQAFLSAVALAINPLLFRTLYLQTYFHKNIRILLGLGAIVNIIHSASFLILQGTHTFLMFTADDGCDLLVSAVFCNLFRYPAYIAVVCYSSLNNSMIFERLVATLRVKNYEDSAKLFGVLLAGFTISSAIIVALIATGGGPLVVGEVPYCALMNSDNISSISSAGLVGAIFQILISILFVTIFYANKWMEKRPLYNVKTQYQIRENLSVCRMLAPWFTFHFVSTFFLMASNYIILTVLSWNIDDMRSKTVIAAVNIMPFFCVLSPVALKVIYDNEGRRRRQGIKNLAKPVTAEQTYLMYTSVWNKA